MSDEQEPKWEEVTDHNAVRWVNYTSLTERLAVPGGWLYLVWPETGDAPVMCFVPDPSAGQGEGK